MPTTTTTAAAPSKAATPVLLLGAMGLTALLAGLSVLFVLSSALFPVDEWLREVTSLSIHDPVSAADGGGGSSFSISSGGLSRLLWDSSPDASGAASVPHDWLDLPLRPAMIGYANDECDEVVEDWKHGEVCVISR